jgi:hypothetical protein
MPDVTGQYDVRTIALMLHEQALEHPQDYNDDFEELAECMDPEGATIAYFVDEMEAEAYCQWQNSRTADTQHAIAQSIGEAAQQGEEAYYRGEYDTLKACLEAIQLHAMDLGYVPTQQGNRLFVTPEKGDA